uniref:CSON014204 protein n=1 Tax=Culicoides sonorensis TaxID=179676 RepID=A0A336M9W8_CULSO
MKISLILIFSTIFIGKFCIQAYPGGAPASVCETMSPRHNGILPQTEPSPFKITLNSTTIENTENLIEVTIESTDPLKEFKGFIIQAREDTSIYKTIGTFSIENEISNQSKAITCQVESDTITHNSRVGKSSMKFLYVAPSGFKGTVTIVATILESFEIFYEKVTSQPISIDTSGQITTTPEITTVLPIDDTFYDDCGIKKSCFGEPDNCIESKSCFFATSVAKNLNGTYFFELITYQRQARYVALALSSIERMGPTTVMECVRESNRDIKKYDSWMTSSRGVTRENVPQNLTQLVYNAIDANLFICRIERENETIVRGERFSLDDTKYHLLLASGSDLLDDGIGYHDLGAKASDMRLLGNIQTFGTPSTLFFRLHGVFMFIAWIGTSTIGIFFARYYKKQWPEKKFMNKDLWFAGHQICMTLTWLFTIVGFVLIFIKVGTWSDIKNPHPILGVITTGLCFIQPLGAMFRPAPNGKNRRWFNWIHLFLGNSAHFLGVLSIIFAVTLPKANLAYEMYYIIIAFAIYYALAHILCSVATEEENIQNSKKEKAKDVNVSMWKNIFLLMHVTIILALTISGIILICKGV